MRCFGVIWSVAVDWTGSVRSQESSGNVREKIFAGLSGKRCIKVSLT